MDINFKNKHIPQILDWFQTHTLKPKEMVRMEFYTVEVEHIGYNFFVDLAQTYMMKMQTPRVIDENSLEIVLVKLDTTNSFHKTPQGREKYGVESEFFHIDKTSQFSFLYHFQKALKFVDIERKKRVLNLGINKGDEFKVIKEMLCDDAWNSKEFVGIDYSASAIEYAQKEFLQDKNIKLLCSDINTLDHQNLGRFDLLLSIGTLQSSNLNFNETFMGIYQKFLAQGGAVVLGFPNCRWVDGEMLYGAKAPNYPFSEMSLLLKDVHFCKKYLQQKRYRVVITGKDYLFLSAKKIK